MNKKLLLGFGTLTVSALPFLAVVGCDVKKEKELLKKPINKEKVLWKKPKHFFYIMADSLTSSRFLDSYNYLESELNTKKDNLSTSVAALSSKSVDNNMVVKKQQLEALKDFNLKMNVISPDYGTSVGLGALISGAKNAAFVQELRRKQNVPRKKMMQEAWNNLITDVANQKNIKKIYINSLEYYQTEKKDSYRSREINKKELNLSNDIKSKIVLPNFKDPHDYYNSENFYKILDDYGSDIKKESNFSFINTLVVHDNFDKWNYNNYHPPYGNKVNFFETLRIFIDKLKKLGIYDSSEIMITSDHGKQMNNYKKIVPSNFKMQNEFFKLDYDHYSWNKNNKNFDLLPHKNKTNEELFYSQSPLSYMTSILYKPINNHSESLTVDYSNLYYSADVISQLYYDMDLPTDNLEFNFYKYMDSIITKENNDGSYNSFVDNPFSKDLSNRVLFSLRKNIGWGLRKSLYLSNQGFIWNGPFWYKDKQNNWKLNDKSIIKFTLDNQKDSKMPWLGASAVKELEKSKDAYKVLGKILDKFKNILGSVKTS